LAGAAAAATAATAAAAAAEAPAAATTTTERSGRLDWTHDMSRRANETAATCSSIRRERTAAFESAAVASIAEELPPGCR
jgi:hypothetical protein